jgi:hypothetical protein
LLCGFTLFRLFARFSTCFLTLKQRDFFVAVNALPLAVGTSSGVAFLIDVGQQCHLSLSCSHPALTISQPVARPNRTEDAYRCPGWASLKEHNLINFYYCMSIKPIPKLSHSKVASSMCLMLEWKHASAQRLVSSHGVVEEDQSCSVV